MPCVERVAQWSRAENLWQARSAVVPFTTVAEMNDYYPLICDSSQVLIRREERFSKTAVGWILREVSRYDPQLVLTFIDTELPHFSTESLKNATKYFDTSLQKDMVTRLRKNKPA